MNAYKIVQFLFKNHQKENQRISSCHLNVCGNYSLLSFSNLFLSFTDFLSLCIVNSCIGLFFFWENEPEVSLALWLFLFFK